jgi:hypothetical protein
MLDPQLPAKHGDDSRRRCADADNLVEEKLFAVYHFPDFICGFILPPAKHLPDAFFQCLYYPVGNGSAKPFQR